MKRSHREALNGYLFASPWIIGFSVLLLYPLVASLYYSFCDYSVLHKPLFIGVTNYTDIIKDEVFWKTIENTGWYAMLALPLGLIVTLCLALLLNSKVRGMSIYRALFYMPSLVPAVSLAILWMWVFNGEHGVLNAIIRPVLDRLSYITNLGLAALNHFPMLHIPLLHLTPPNWLSDPAWSKPALIVMSIWGAGNTVVIYLAGLQDVPQQLYEAADLDGAGWWKKTMNVTLPMLSPVILFNLIMGIIGTLQVFTIPYIMFPGGAPARSTYFYSMYLYDKAFRDLQMGYACAMGWIMFLFILALTQGALRLSKKYVYYEGT